ncbi:MAG: HAMP domain-containing protein, partial [Pseudoflavonifractor sp.]
MEGKKTKFKGIRKRWMVNSISTVLLIVLLAVTAFSVALAGYYYSSMSTGLEAKAKNAAGYSGRTQSEYLQYAQLCVNTFEDRDSIQLQFISATGAVQFSSYGVDESFGLSAGTSPSTQDIADAINHMETSLWTGSDPTTGEHIMAVSSPLIVNGSVAAVARMVTSLRAVDFQIAAVIGIALLVGILILALVYFSNLYFVRSIVEPVAGITDTAKRIAAGSYGIQIEKKFDDEIGELTDTINDMSLKIKQTEKMKSEFIASVSHELRTPLTAINGWAETIMNGEVRDAADVKKGMGIIVSEARRLTN